MLYSCFNIRQTRIIYKEQVSGSNTLRKPKQASKTKMFGKLNYFKLNAWKNWFTGPFFEIEYKPAESFKTYKL